MDKEQKDVKAKYDEAIEMALELPEQMADKDFNFGQGYATLSTAMGYMLLHETNEMSPAEKEEFINKTLKKFEDATKKTIEIFKEDAEREQG